MAARTGPGPATIRPWPPEWPPFWPLPGPYSCWLCRWHGCGDLQDRNEGSRLGMTGERRETQPFALVGALDRVIVAGLRLRWLGGDEPWLEAVCPACAATMIVPGQPWDPVEAARRLDVFTLLHHNHVGRDSSLEDEW